MIKSYNCTLNTSTGCFIRYTSSFTRRPHISILYMMTNVQLILSSEKKTHRWSSERFCVHVKLKFKCMVLIVKGTHALKSWCEIFIFLCDRHVIWRLLIWHSVTSPVKCFFICLLPYFNVFINEFRHFKMKSVFLLSDASLCDLALTQCCHAFCRGAERSIHHWLTGHPVYNGTDGRVQRRQGVGADQSGPKLSKALCLTGHCFWFTAQSVTHFKASINSCAATNTPAGSATLTAFT